MIYIYSITRDSITNAEHINGSIDGKGPQIHTLLTAACHSSRADASLLYRYEMKKNIGYLTVRSDVEPDAEIMKANGFAFVASQQEKEVNDGDIVLVNAKVFPNKTIPVNGKSSPMFLKNQDDRRNWFYDRMAKSGLELTHIEEEKTEFIEVKGTRKDDRTKNAFLKGVTFTGYGRVTDKNAFRQKVHDGLGKGKNYGLGMIVVAIP